MTNFEKFKIASLVALAWDRKEYDTIDNKEAWARGYDAEGELLIWEGNEAADCIAIADSHMPEEIEITVGGGPSLQIFVMDMKTGELRNA